VDEAAGSAELGGYRLVGGSECSLKDCPSQTERSTIPATARGASSGALTPSVLSSVEKQRWEGVVFGDDPFRWLVRAVSLATLRVSGLIRQIGRSYEGWLP
jgi:hypothetical protein